MGSYLSVITLSVNGFNDSTKRQKVAECIEKQDRNIIGKTDVEAETPILWPPDAKSWLIGKSLWCWERLRAGGEGDSRGWDGWMASLTQWTSVWVDSSSWWWTQRPDVLWFMGSQRVRHDRANELNGTEKRPTSNQGTHTVERKAGKWYFMQMETKRKQE